MSETVQPKELTPAHLNFGCDLAGGADQSTIQFFATGLREILRLESNGDIYVHGKLVENDKQVVDGLREFLAAAKAAG